MKFRKKKFKARKLPSSIQLNTYELNKMAYARLPILEQGSSERGAALQMLAKYVTDHEAAHYFMLLNNEAHYYTIFHVDEKYEENLYAPIDDCILALGDLISIEYNDNTDACECWIKYNNEVKMYVFFSYDMGVIECHR